MDRWILIKGKLYILTFVRYNNIMRGRSPKIICATPFIFIFCHTPLMQYANKQLIGELKKLMSKMFNNILKKIWKNFH